MLQFLDRYSLDAGTMVSKSFHTAIIARNSCLPLRIIKSVNVSRVAVGYWTLVEGRCSPRRYFEFDSDSATEALHEVLKLCNDGVIERLRITGHPRKFRLGKEASLVLQKILSNITVKEATFHNVSDSGNSLQTQISMTKGLESLDLAWRTLRVTDAFLYSLLHKGVAEVRIADAKALTDEDILRFCLGSSAVSRSTGIRSMDLNCPGISKAFFHKLIQAFFADNSITPIALMVSTDGCFDITPYAALNYAYCEDFGKGVRYVFAAAKHPFEIRVDGDRYELYRNCSAHPMSEIKKARRRKRT